MSVISQIANSGVQNFHPELPSFERGKRLYEELLPELQRADLSDSEKEPFIEARKAVDVAYKFFLSIKDGGEEMKDRALSVKLFGSVSYEKIPDGLRDFMVQNKLHNACQAVGMKFIERDGIVYLPHIRNGHLNNVAWQGLQKISVDDKIEYRTSQNELIFTTDASGILTDETAITSKGFVAHRLHHADSLIPYKTRVPEEGEPPYYVDIVIRTVKKQGDGIGGYQGQHSFLELGTPQDVTSFGKYPQSFDVYPADGTWSSFATPGALKKGYFESPDQYSYLPEYHSNKFSVRFAVTAEKFEKIKKRLVEDHMTQDTAFGNLHRNCTSYVRQILAEELGHPLDVEIPIGDYVTMIYMPQWLQDGFASVVAWTPNPIKTIFSLAFKPFYFLYCIGIGSVIYMLTMKNEQGFTESDTSVWEVLTGTMTIDHPTKLRSSLGDAFPTKFVEISEAG